LKIRPISVISGKGSFSFESSHNLHPRKSAARFFAFFSAPFASFAVKAFPETIQENPRNPHHPW